MGLVMWGAAASVQCAFSEAFVKTPPARNRMGPCFRAGVCGLRAAGLVEGESVTVVGAASPVGRLISETLLKDGRFRVRLVSNSPAVLLMYLDMVLVCSSHM